MNIDVCTEAHHIHTSPQHSIVCVPVVEAKIGGGTQGLSSGESEYSSAVIIADMILSNYTLWSDGGGQDLWMKE